MRGVVRRWAAWGVIPAPHPRLWPSLGVQLLRARSAWRSSARDLQWRSRSPHTPDWVRFWLFFFALTSRCPSPSREWDVSRWVWSVLVGGRSQQVAWRPPFPTTRGPQLNATYQLGSCSGMAGRVPDARSREAWTRGRRCTQRTREQSLDGIAGWLGVQGRHNRAPCVVPPSAGAALRGGPGSPAATSESIWPDFSL